MTEDIGDLAQDLELRLLRAAQLETKAYRRGRREALEEAAKVAETEFRDYWDTLPDTVGKDIAVAIRSLMKEDET